MTETDTGTDWETLTEEDDIVGPGLSLTYTTSDSMNDSFTDADTEAIDDLYGAETDDDQFSEDDGGDETLTQTITGTYLSGGSTVTVDETDTTSGSFTFHDAGTDDTSSSAPEDLEDGGSYKERGKDTTTVHESGQKYGLDGGVARFALNEQASDGYTTTITGSDDWSSSPGDTVSITIDSKGSSSGDYTESGSNATPWGSDTYTLADGSTSSYTDHFETDGGAITPPRR